MRNDTAVKPLAARRFAVPGALFCGALVWAFLQTLGPVDIAYRHPIWQMAEAALGLPLKGAIGIDPAAAVSLIVRLMSYAAIFWLAAQHAQSHRRARRLVEAAALSAAVYAAYGLGVFLSGSETILGYEKWAYRGYLTGTFVNRNHFGAFCGLGLLCAVGAVMWRTSDRESGPGALVRHLRRDTAYYAAASLVLALALLFTASRAGIAATALGLFVLIVARADVAAARRTWILLLCAAAAGFALAFVFVWRDVSAFGDDFASRLNIYRLSAELLAQRPWLGYGLGSFAAAFAAIRPPEVTQVWTEAHNTYLELAIELGIPAAFCFVGAIAAILAAMLRGDPRGAVPAVALAASATIGTHSLVDFPAQIPAVAAYWAALLGAGFGRSAAPR